MKTIFVGISGGTGSGKSTVANALKEHFKDSLTIIHYDDYYKNVEDHEDASKINFDNPEQLNRNRLYEDMKDLINMKSINKPTYDFKSHKSTNFEIIEPNQIILLDGIFALYDNSLNELMDIKIFVDMDADLRILRRTQRDIKERGRDVDSIIEQYISTVKDSHYQFVAPQKWKADFIIPNNIVRETPKCDEIITLLTSKLKDIKNNG